jgi:hypothetical protein
MKFQDVKTEIARRYGLSAVEASKTAAAMWFKDDAEDQRHLKRLTTETLHAYLDDLENLGKEKEL